ncbi:MAG: GNAT family N-acetyltransferase [Ilumatobacteraceae bacterium]
MSDIDIRPVEVHERRQAADTFRTALISGAISDEMMETTQGSWDNGVWLAAWDDERCVGHVGAFRFDTTVPGGARLPTAGYSRVGVLPTHTRRGLLTQLMQRSLREAHEEGQVLASLRASEAPIYGRFGYGQAGDFVAMQITSAKARPLRGNRAGGSMRLLRLTEVLDVVPPLYDRVARRWVGTIGRPDWMWMRYLKGATEPASAPFGKGEFVAVHTDPSGVDDGYVHYETDLVEGFAVTFSGGGTVHDLFGASAEVELALWQYLFDIDLIATWQAEERPVNDPIRRALHDVRAYETRQIIDEQWIRLLDVDAALTARSYGPCSETLTIAVTDPLLEANNDRWAISSAGARRTTEPADVIVDIATLSTAYMGGVAWRDLAASALLPTEVDDALLDRLDALFAIRPVGYCGSFF